MERGRVTPWLLAGALFAGSGALGAAAVKPPAPEQARFFETSIRPLLIDNCAKCHGPSQQTAGLRVDSLAALLKGGARGPAVVPGSPERSLALLAAAHREGAPRMPPGKKLSDRQLADLARWIRDGAHWPGAAAAAPARAARHWAFQPVRPAAVPAVRNRAWIQSPVDAFILARLEEKGLRPAPPADRRTLIRRATFDLTGLPPTPAEVDAFVADPSPDAFAKVVERLLASPHYGERWGRHWLDVARYADSNGLDENVHYGNAWRYRDWVIDAFNRDMPYDRFLVDQIAGDLLPESDPERRRERLIATGFLAIGPKFISEVDTEKVLVDTVDEQVDTLGRTVMGLTLGCARCHDHKFDPISAKDYYALAGIFKSTLTLDALKKPRMWVEHSIATPEQLARHEAHQKEVEARKAEIAALVERGKARLQAEKPGAALPKNPEPAFPEETRAELQRLRDGLAALEKSAPELPMAMGVKDGTIADMPIHERGSHLALGETVPRRFPAILASAGGAAFDRQESGRRQLAQWLVSPDHPLTSRVMANRVWRWHFGRGIVASTDNFGLLGDDPTHPELLDWLAVEFRRGAAAPSPFAGAAWSIKRLHRLLMLSSTYQMSAAHDPRAAAVDPDNRLRWRADVRRMEAEQIRDAILAVGGLLDRTMGGRPLALKNREYLFDHTSRDATRYDSVRRAVYLPVIRNNLYDMFQLFDFGDGAVPEGSRPATTVAPQALFMLNSDVVMNAAEGMADAVLKQEAETARRIELLHRQAFGRPARREEVSRGAALVAELERAAQAAAGDPAARRRQAWSWYCHTLLAANEFIYLR